MNNDQVLRGIKTIAAQQKKTARNIYLALAALGILIITLFIGLFLTIRASNSNSDLAAVLNSQLVASTQKALFDRCVAVVNAEGVSNPRNYEGVVDFCVARRTCDMTNPNATASAQCLDKIMDATRTAEFSGGS
jgi:hypothetical protein